MTARYTYPSLIADIARASGDRTPSPPSPPEELGWLELDDGLSNFDREIPSGLEDRLRAGECFCGYCGYDFYAHVWFAGGSFTAYVKQYRRHVATIAAPTLGDLMKAVSDQFGSD
jgi:hypothetical protein